FWPSGYPSSCPTCTSGTSSWPMCSPWPGPAPPPASPPPPCWCSCPPSAPMWWCCGRPTPASLPWAGSSIPCCARAASCWEPWCSPPPPSPCSSAGSPLPRKPENSARPPLEAVGAPCCPYLYNRNGYGSVPGGADAEAVEFHVPLHGDEQIIAPVDGAPLHQVALFRVDGEGGGGGLELKLAAVDQVGRAEGRPLPEALAALLQE